jgi:hypothetical protein
MRAIIGATARFRDGWTIAEKFPPQFRHALVTSRAGEAHNEEKHGVRTEADAMVYHVSDDEKELAHAIREGAKHRPHQSFGEYFKGRQRSCALGAAYEGIYRLPEDADGLRPKRLDRFFDCLDGVVRRCP